MLETILTTLSTISSVKTIFEIVYGVSNYTSNKSKDFGDENLAQGFLSYGEESLAITKTFEEWQTIAFLLEPKIEEEFNKKKPKSLLEKAKLLEQLSKKYINEPSSSKNHNSINRRLFHTAISIPAINEINLHLGASKETNSLFGEEIHINESNNSIVYLKRRNMALPTFKVTMLGGSTAGKTVFMGSMYCKMRDGEDGIRIRGINQEQDIDLDLQTTDIYENGRYPNPTSGDDKKLYEFELQLNGTPIARIDWVDYRGGMIIEANQKVLTERLKESHAIIWMLDLGDKVDESLSSFATRLKTKIGIMGNLCLNAIAESNDIRSILFVRTKSDQVRTAGNEIDAKLACEGLIKHLGDFKNIKGLSRSAAIPVSAVGRIDSNGQPIGDDPLNVQWALILALGFMFEKDRDLLDLHKNEAKRKLENTQNTYSSFFREIFHIRKSQEEVQDTAQLANVTLQFKIMDSIIEKLLAKMPEEIQIFKKD